MNCKNLNKIFTPSTYSFTFLKTWTQKDVANRSCKKRFSEFRGLNHSSLSSSIVECCSTLSSRQLFRVEHSEPVKVPETYLDHSSFSFIESEICFAIEFNREMRLVVCKIESGKICITAAPRLNWRLFVVWKIMRNVLRGICDDFK